MAGLEKTFDKVWGRFSSPVFSFKKPHIDSVFFLSYKNFQWANPTSSFNTLAKG